MPGLILPMGYEIDESYTTLKRDHESNLAKHGVILHPLYKSGGEYVSRTLQLIVLHANLGMYVHKDDIAEYVARLVPGAAKDQQPRHIKYDGWDLRLSGKARDTYKGELVPNGYYVLAQIMSPERTFELKRSKRKGRSTAADFDELCIVYDNKCGVCGKLKPLEQGHMNPDISTFEFDNLIPLCSDCNNWQSDDFIIDDDGRVVALSSSRAVLKSSETVQYQIFLELSRKYKK